MSKRTTTDWPKIIEEQRISGETQVEWCRKKQINLHTFRNQKGRMFKTSIQHKHKLNPAKENRRIQWLSVKPEPAGTHGRMIRVNIGSFTIVPEPDFNEADFTRICRVLQTLC